MSCKILAIALLAAAANAGIIQSPVAYSAPLSAEDYDPNPQYSYGYQVQDSLTGDNKQQQETRNGDVVQGSYSLVDSDGTIRTVEYTADPVNGFNAVVSRQAIGAPAVAKIAAPVAYAAPVAKYGAPLAYASPLGGAYYH